MTSLERRTVELDDRELSLIRSALAVLALDVEKQLLHERCPHGQIDKIRLRERLMRTESLLARLR